MMKRILFDTEEVIYGIEHDPPEIILHRRDPGGKLWETVPVGEVFSIVHAGGPVAEWLRHEWGIDYWRLHPQSWESFLAPTIGGAS
jgi:hypothetical protein